MRIPAMVSAVAAIFWLAPAAVASASVLISVDKSRQVMTVSVDGFPRYRWSVSTGRPDHGTPTGSFQPQRLERSWFSTKYYNSPMPHSIFFHHGFAIHGSNEISRLGGPASHGCVRLHPENAATLYSLVQREGAAATSIVISGQSYAEYETPRRTDDEPLRRPQRSRYLNADADDAPTFRSIWRNRN